MQAKECNWIKKEKGVSLLVIIKGGFYFRNKLVLVRLAIHKNKLFLFSYEMKIFSIFLNGDL